MGSYEQIEKAIRRIELDPKDDSLYEVLLKELKRIGVDLVKYMKGRDLCTILGIKPDDTELNLNGRNITDLDFLYRVPCLIELIVMNSKIEDISGIRALKKLELVDLTENRITDISPVRCLENLRLLSFSNNAVKDITALGELKQLTQLRFISKGHLFLSFIG